jgi:hypothetical protein
LIRGIISILLYLLAISISIIMTAQGEVILIVFWMIVTGIIFSIGVFMNNLTLKNKPGLHNMFNNPNRIEHIIMAISFLVLAFIPRIFLFFWPAVGTMLLLSAEPTFVAVTVPVISLTLGGIFSYWRYQSSTDNLSLNDDN